MCDELDRKIEVTEVKKIIMKSKCKKACGFDLISNEMLKVGVDSLLEPITNLFNLIINTDKYPAAWSTGIPARNG